MASPVPQKEDVERWTVEQVAAWLRQMELTDCCEFFLRKGIDGHSLMELTEEGLVLWGRDVSIRNRKKILKLIKQIENQYLVSTGRLQPNKLPKNIHGGYDPGKNTSDGEANCAANCMDDDDDGFTSDEFDDDDVDVEDTYNEDSNSGQAGYFTDSSSGEGIYLKPLPAPNRNFPPQPLLPLPNKPSTLHGKNHQPHVPPEKRPPMPLPHSGGANQGPPTSNSNQRFGGQIGGPKLPPDYPKRLQPPLSGSSSDPPRRPPPIPGASNNLHKPYTGAPIPTAPKPSWPPKKPSELSSQNSSQSESNSEGGGIGGRLGFGAPNKKPSFLTDLQQKLNVPPVQSSSFPVEDNDGEYEVVESPPGTFLGNDVHIGSPLGPSQAPPPLPQRNQDGRDSRSGGTNLQLPSTGSNVGHSRLLAQPPSLPNMVSPPAGPSSISQNRQNKIPLPPRPSHSPERKQKPGVLNRLPPNVGQPLLPPAPHLAQHPSQPNLNNPPLERAPAIPTSVSLQSPGGGSHGVERVPIGEGESIELTPLYRTLMDRPFFHLISRSKSKQLLERDEDGLFLIRPSTRSSDPLTLCLRYSGRTYNINIRQRRDGLYALGSEKTNEVSFHNIDEIVSTYTSEPIKLQSGERVILSKSPTKMDHIYVKMPDTLRKKY